MKRAAGTANGSLLGKMVQDGQGNETASLRSFAARNAAFLLALILIGSPVARPRPHSSHSHHGPANLVPGLWFTF